MRGWMRKAPWTLAMPGVVLATFGVGLLSSAQSAWAAPGPSVSPSATSIPGAGALGAPASVPAVAAPLEKVLGVGGPELSTPVAGGGQVTAASSSSRLTVDPDTNLTKGEKVSVTGSGMADSSYGSVIECNLANNEPTVQVEGNAVPVGCTNPLQSIQSTNSSGGFSTTFTIQTGTIGPPGQGTDSAGNPASADAAKYPCPPTPAQQAAGTTCDIVFGDVGGDQDTTPIQFAQDASGSAQAAVTPGSASKTSVGAADSPSTASGSAQSGATGGAGAAASGGGPLAFTGVGPGVQTLMWLGPLLVLSGSLILIAAASVRRWTARVSALPGGPRSCRAVVFPARWVCTATVSGLFRR